MMEQVLDIPGQEIITADNAMVGVDAVVFFQVLDAPKAAYEVHGLHRAIMALTNHQSAHGDGIDGSGRDTVQTRRDQCAAAQRGRPCDLALGDQDHPRRDQGFRPPSTISEAMARQMKAERLKRAEILEAEGGPRLEHPARRGQQTIGDPQGRRPARSRVSRGRGARARRRGGGAGDPIGVRTRSPRPATRRSTTSSRRNTPRRWESSPPAPTPRTILFPVEATQLIGSLGGIGELVRDAIGSESVDRAVARKETVPVRAASGTPLTEERARVTVPVSDG